MTDKPKLGDAMREAMPPLEAPPALRAWARDVAAQTPPNVARPRVRAWAVAASLLLGAVLGWSANQMIARGANRETNVMVAQLVDAHVRSTLPGHLTDVLSTDQHTVKPWFVGRADFAPRVVNLDSLGFPLLGGRLDYLNGRTVVALVYGRRKHVVNLFMWPQSADADDGRTVQTVYHGYAVQHWTNGGLTYWAVTDAAAEDLDVFRRAFLSAR